MQKETVKLGFFGFGEAASIFAAGLRERWPDLKLLAYDKFVSGITKERAERTGTELAVGLSDFVERADVICSFVTGSTSLAAAHELSPLLTEQHTYIDFNSVSPKQKQSIAAAVAPSRARVVDGAVMGSAPENGLNVSILLSGHGAAEVSGILSGLGFNCRAVGVQVGEAAAIKMVRSVFAKGLEALFVEMLLAGKKYGVQEQVIQSVCESLENKSIRSVMNTLVVSLANHSARKKTEMDYVAEVLLDVGVQPEMTNGTRRVLEWITSMDIKQELPADGFDYHDIINAIENRSAK